MIFFQYQPDLSWAHSDLGKYAQLFGTRGAVCSADTDDFCTVPANYAVLTGADFKGGEILGRVFCVSTEASFLFANTVIRLCLCFASPDSEAAFCCTIVVRRGLGRNAPMGTYLVVGLPYCGAIQGTSRAQTVLLASSMALPLSVEQRVMNLLGTCTHSLTWTRRKSSLIICR